MEDLGFPAWSNISHHHQYQHHDNFEETFIFGSGNIFFNPTQIHLQKTDPIICSSGPIATAASIQQMGRGESSQYQSTANLIPTTVTCLESLDCCLLSATINNNNISTGVSSSGNSVSKDQTDDDGIIVSSQKRPINVGSSSCYDDPPRSKRSRSDPIRPASSTINFRQASSESDETDSEAIAQMKEMIYRAAAFRPVSFADDEVAEKPRRKNVRISSDPQTVAARQRRERISDRIRVLQKLVPGGNKMDTASMLDEAANYLKFLRSQIKELEQFGQKQQLLEYHHVSPCGTTTYAHSTSQKIIQSHCIINPNNNNNNNNNVTTTLGVPFPMQPHFLLPHHHQQLNLP